MCRMIFTVTCAPCPCTLPLLGGLWRVWTGMESHYPLLFIWQWGAWLAGPNPHGASWHTIHPWRSHPVQPVGVVSAIKRMWALTDFTTLPIVFDKASGQARSNSTGDWTRVSAVVGERDCFCLFVFSVTLWTEMLVSWSIHHFGQDWNF